MAFGLSAGAATLLGAVAAPVIGGMFQSGAASDAANAQAQGAAASDATQRYFYDTSRADNAPFLKNGTAASNKLSYLMGIGNPSSKVDYVTQSYRDNLGRDPHASEQGLWAQYGREGMSEAEIQNAIATSSESVTNAGRAKYSAAPEAAQDSSFGSLNRRFSQSDLANDVPYQTGMQFGLDQGTQGINNQASATGSMLSGATLKALTRFGNDYGNQKAGDAYNRYNTDNTNTYNRLAGLAGSGQTASGQVGSAGMNAGNNISQSQMGMGNARGASQIAQGNAMAGGLTGAYNNYQNNQLLDTLKSRNRWRTSGANAPSIWGNGNAFSDTGDY